MTGINAPLVSAGLCRAWLASECGYVRTNHEDCCAVSAAAPGRQRWSGALAADGGWALVADGMGGHKAGEVASRLAIEQLAPHMETLRTAGDVAGAIQSANAHIYEAMAADPALDGMGTTIVGAVLRGKSALVFNVGDSRAYLMAADKLLQVSVDHGFGSMLTQCLGGTPKPISLDPFVATLKLEPGSKLLLCTDGLTDMLEDGEIARILASDAPDPAAALIEAALEAGGVDNVTTVVVEAFVSPDAQRAPGRGSPSWRRVPPDETAS